MASIIGVETLQHTNGTEAATIDSSGRLKRSVLPAWRVGLVNDQAETTAASLITIDWDSTDNDTKHHFLQNVSLTSSGIVAPIDGIYQAQANIRVDSVGSGYIAVQIVLNDETSTSNYTYAIMGQPPTNYVTLNLVDTFKLDANDTIKIKVYISTDTNYNIDNRSTFSGHLVG